MKFLWTFVILFLSHWLIAQATLSLQANYINRPSYFNSRDAFVERQFAFEATYRKSLTEILAWRIGIGSSFWVNDVLVMEDNVSADASLTFLHKNQSFNYYAFLGPAFTVYLPRTVQLQIHPAVGFMHHFARKSIETEYYFKYGAYAYAKDYFRHPSYGAVVGLVDINVLFPINEIMDVYVGVGSFWQLVNKEYEISSRIESSTTDLFSFPKSLRGHLSRQRRYYSNNYNLLRLTFGVTRKLSE